MTLRNASELPQYAEMKDSGVAWLGKIPSHWKVLPNRILFEEVKERDHPEEQMLSVTIKRGVIRQNELLDGSSQKDSSNLDKSAYKQVKPGDIAYNKMRAWQGAVGVSEYQGIVSPAYVVERPRNRVSSNFFHFLLRTPGFAKEAERWSYGITSDMWSLRPEHFKMIYSCLPPLPEQIAIVRFLDHADRRIRRNIRAKQKLIALLEEQKQAIIHQAVTGQIDVRTGKPYSSYKDSGVEWLGEVPKHWQIGALHHRYSQCLGKMLDSKRITGNHSLPYLRNVDVQWDQINTKDLPSMDIAPDEYERYTVQLGDLLVCEGGEIGRCALWSRGLRRCGFQKALHRLRPRNARQDMPRFMYYALRAAAKADAFNDGHLSTIAHLTGEKLRVHRFPFPPVAEQQLLVRFLDGVVEQIDHTVSCVHREIDLLQEYRTRLIADVVTGKLDVREAAAELPEDDVPGDDESAEEYAINSDVTV